VIASADIAVYRVRVKIALADLVDVDSMMDFAWGRKVVDIKKLLLVGMLVIVAVGAFVYLDPMGLNLLGLKQESAVAKPVTPTHPVAPAPVAPANKPVAAVATPHPAAVPAPVPPVTTMTSAASKAEKPAATKSVAAPIQAPEPPIKSSETVKSSSTPAIDKPVRPKNLDMRHCLKLETDAAIAKCAGE
jgi:hypothetical protein